MKIAIGFCGQFRNVEKTYNQYLKENLFNNNHDIDVYVHSWLNQEDLGKQIRSSQDIVKNNLHGTASDVVPQNIISMVQNFYNPCCMQIERQKVFNDSRISLIPIVPDNKFIVPQNSLSKMFSTKKVLQLIEESEKSYDLILITRFDIAFGNPIKFEDIDPNIISVGSLQHDVAMDVLYSFGGLKVQKQFVELYDSAIDYCLRDGITFVDERLAFYHCKKNNIPFCKKEFYHHIVRAGSLRY